MATPGRTGSSTPKPWERPGAASQTSGALPFAPASNTGSTAAAVTAAGTATTEAEKQEIARNGAAASGTVAGRPMPPRPWETNSGTGFGTGGYGSMNYNRAGYGGGMYGSNYGGYGSMYGGGYGGGSMYGSGMYGNRYGGYGGYSGYGGMGNMGGYGMNGMGGYGMGGMGGDPNNPDGSPPPRAPGFWVTMLRGLQGFMFFFGRLSMLVDENTQAFHFFITALLQLFDRAGVLYGELARFVLRLLRIRSGSRSRARSKSGAKAIEGNDGSVQDMIVKPSSPQPAWDNLWSDDRSA